MNHIAAMCGTFVLMGCMPGLAQAAPPADAGAGDGPTEAKLFEHMEKALKNPRDTPGLPRVLLIGDSISIGYTVPVRQVLQGKANVHRPPENCQHTGYGLKKIKSWLGTGTWDVIHFNWGIWDTHYLDAKTGALVRSREEPDLASGTVRIRHTPEQYREQLTALVRTVQATGARLVWASSTPILFRKGARFDDIRIYNEVAAGVMAEHGIAVNDLYAFTLPHAAEWQDADQCHFNALGNRNLGEKVGQAILDALARGRP